MYSPEDDYYRSSLGGLGGSYGGSYYGRPSYLGGRSYMVSTQHTDTHCRS